MKYRLVTKKEAIKKLEGSPGDRVLIATYDLESDESTLFFPSGKKECERIINDSGSVAAMTNDFIEKLECFTGIQNDLENIKHEGVIKIILLQG